MSTPPHASAPTATTSGSPEPLLGSPQPHAALLGWGRINLRDLPWRHTRDPWAVLVSEVMAQQTQIERVVPKWEAFLGRWPTPAACADAPLADVLRLWSGLGYPRRARNLHLAAGLIVERHAGQVPEDLDALLALPGVGPYTASAVLTFAYEHDLGVVDTNIARVLARVEGRRLGAAEARRVAQRWVPAGEGWWWSQSLMELGARHCRPRDPACGPCPISQWCRWFQDGSPAPDPAAGSALVSSRQPRFAGSAREARGRLLAAAGLAPVAKGQVGEVIGSDDVDRVRLVVRSLLDDGLLVEDGAGRLHLP